MTSQVCMQCDTLQLHTFNNNTNDRSFCCWRRRACRLSEGGQLFCLPQSLLFLYQSRSKLGGGRIAPCSLGFLTEVGGRLSAATDDARETAFLFQRISVALQRFNAILIHESFVAPDVEPDL